jgi:hypothetical protein
MLAIHHCNHRLRQTLLQIDQLKQWCRNQYIVDYVLDYFKPRAIVQNTDHIFGYYVFTCMPLL